MGGPLEQILQPIRLRLEAGLTGMKVFMRWQMLQESYVGGIKMDRLEDSWRAARLDADALAQKTKGFPGVPPGDKGMVVQTKDEGIKYFSEVLHRAKFMEGYLRQIEAITRRIESDYVKRMERLIHAIIRNSAGMLSTVAKDGEKLAIDRAGGSIYGGKYKPVDPELGRKMLAMHKETERKAEELRRLMHAQASIVQGFEAAQSSEKSI